MAPTPRTALLRLAAALAGTDDPYQVAGDRQFEPLQRMVTHFAECVRDGKTPLTDGEAGLRVVRILDAAQRSVKAQGGRIAL